IDQFRAGIDQFGAGIDQFGAGIDQFGAGIDQFWRPILSQVARKLIGTYRKSIP
ncbi:hypothetical protein WUBG_17614, partial [Wuchereria bancrofti]